jgi:hypothetical protein
MNVYVLRYMCRMFEHIWDETIMKRLINIYFEAGGLQLEFTE